MMERLTTDNPQNNTEVALNLVYVKDGQAWVRNGGPDPGYPDVTLYDYMRLIIACHGPMSIKGEFTDDELGDALDDALFDGIETKEGLVALLYTLAWAFAELRHRLAEYEDTGLEPEVCVEYKKFEDEAVSKNVPFSRIIELMNADADGRLMVLPCKVGGELWVNDKDGKPRRMVLDAPDIRCHCAKEDNLCMALCDSPNAGICAYRLKNDGTDFGKTVFLTREEAEAALGGADGAI